MLSLETLGSLRLVASGEGERLAGRRKELGLLVFLAGRSPEPVPRETLAALLWGDREEARARHSLRQALLRLRRTVGEGLEVEAESVTLRSGVLELDTRRLEVELAEGRAEEALALWRGEFLAGLDDVGDESWQLWLFAERERLRRLLSDSLDPWLERARAEGEWERSLALASAWAERFPYEERAERRRVEALRGEGRFQEALRYHDAFVMRLARELELTPSQEFLELRERLEPGAEADPSAQRTPGSVALFTPAMVGRAPAMSELHAAWSGVVAGDAAVVVVEGDAGIGKTLLCEEFLRELASGEEPALILQSRARSDDGAPWSAARELLAGLAGAAGLGGVADETLAVLARLVPAVRTRYPHLPAAAGGDDALVAAIVDTVAMVAEEAPAVLFLDDAAQADAESRTALIALLRSASAHVLALVTVRTGEAEAGALLRELSAVRGRRHLKLAPLAPGEVDDLVHSMLELPAPERRALSARLHAETGGNPFYAMEIVSALVDEGQLSLDARGIWRTAAGSDGNTLPLPHGVRDAVGRRLTGLPGRARDLVGAAAVVGEPIDVGLLAAVLGWPPADFDGVLEELLARRLLRESPAHDGRFEFIHPLVRRVAYDDVPHSRRLALHRTAAERLAPDAGTDPERLAAVRFHRERGGPAGTTPRRRGRLTAGAAAAIILIVTAFGLWRLGSGPSSPPPLLAIGWLEDLRGPATGGPRDALVDMLATNLARVPGLQVVSTARMYEMMGELGPERDPRAAFAGAARQVGAAELLEGSLLEPSAGRLRLDLRRVDLGTGAVRHATSVEASDVFELVDLATTAVASGLGLRTTPLHLADATTASLVAYRFYEEGLRKFAGADYRAALQLFDAAQAEDTAFAMAAFYDWRTRNALLLPTPPDVTVRMLRLAERAPDRDRLLIRGSWALSVNEPLLTAVAETLAIRYPTEMEGQYLVGMSRFWNGEFAQARAAFERVVAMDSLGLGGSRPRCLACDALEQIVTLDIHTDSMARAERVAREWVAGQPASARAWRALSEALLFGGRPEDAGEARRRANELNPIDAYDAVFPGIVPIYSGQFAAADHLLRDLSRTGVLAVQQEALWYLAISLRNQGRLFEALATERHRRDLARAAADQVRQDVGGARHAVQILFEMGRYGEAADSLRALDAALDAAATDGFTARQRVVNLTQLATVLAAEGDTASLPALADSIETWGTRSAYGRDRRLHYHVRGLTFEARGAFGAAADAFRRAMFSPTSGYTRTNLELARVLLALGRPDSAIAVLEPALRGPLDASGLFVTRTDVEELLGRAWEAAGQPDSAAAWYRHVLESWSNANPDLRPRVDSIGERLRTLESRR